VTDKSSQPPAASANLSERVGIGTCEPAPAPTFRRLCSPPPQKGWVACQICGRRGRWVDPFPPLRR
jgi:hypothetical protein